MPSHRLPPRSYERTAALVQRFALLLLLTFACMAAASAAPEADAPEKNVPVKLVVLGDSISAGFGLPAAAALPARLAAALKQRGLAAEVTNAGVSGDTASGGLQRLEWSVPEGTDAVILELGANDALRGIDPKVTKAALDAILTRLEQRHIAVLLAGMRAPRNMGPDYVKAFDAIYPALASAHRVVFYPFILDGVAADPALNQHDGMHPNAKGVDVIVARMLPKVQELISRARAARGS